MALVSPGNVPITQTLTGFTLAANTTYMLTMAVGTPADRIHPEATFGFELGLDGSSTNVLSFYSSHGTLTPGSFAEKSASGAVSAGSPDIGKTLVVRLYGPQGAGPGAPFTVFDNVRLTAVPLAAPVPEPAEWALLCGGLLLVLVLRGRHNSRGTPA